MIFAILLCIFSIWIGWKKVNSIVFPPTLFALLWSAISILFAFRLIPYYSISYETPIVIGVGVLSFTIGGLLTKKKDLRPLSDDNTSINIYLFFAFAILEIYFAFPEMIKSIAAIKMGVSLEDIRGESDSFEYKVGLVPYLRNFLLTPISYICYPVYSYIVLSKKYKAREIIIASILTTVLIVSSVVRLGGRSPIIFMVISLIMTFFFLKKKITFSRKNKVIILTVIVIAVIAFYYTSLSRGIEDVDTSIYAYFTCCIPLLNQGINNVDTYYLGTATFSSPISLIGSFFNLIGLGRLPAQGAIDALNIAVDETVSVGEGIHYNAFYSLFYWFYLDFGLIGVVIFSAMYGWLCTRFYYKAISRPSSKNVIVFSFLIQGLLLSFIRFHFATYYYFMAFVISPILFSKKKHN